MDGKSRCGQLSKEKKSWWWAAHKGKYSSDLKKYSRNTIYGGNILLDQDCSLGECNAKGFNLVVIMLNLELKPEETCPVPAFHFICKVLFSGLTTVFLVSVQHLSLKTDSNNIRSSLDLLNKTEKAHLKFLLERMKMPLNLGRARAKNMQTREKYKKSSSRSVSSEVLRWLSHQTPAWLLLWAEAHFLHTEHCQEDDHSLPQFPE